MATLWIAEISSKRIIFQACPPLIIFWLLVSPQSVHESSFADLKAKETLPRHFSKRLNARAAWLIEDQQREKAYIYMGMILSELEKFSRAQSLNFCYLIADIIAANCAQQIGTISKGSIIIYVRSPSKLVSYQNIPKSILRVGVSPIKLNWTISKNLNTE